MKQINKLCVILFFTGIFNITSILAEEADQELLSAGELLESCEDGSVPGSPNEFCMRYVFGMVQVFESLRQAEQSPPIFCINPQVTPLQEATDNVIAHLRKQSSRANEDAQDLVLEALVKYYPCSGLGSQT